MFFMRQLPGADKLYTCGVWQTGRLGVYSAATNYAIFCNIGVKQMTMKKLGLLAVFCLSIAFCGCGGGGGSSNPAGSTADPAADLVLQAETPAIFNAYASMQTSLEEDITKTPAQRVALFMPYIAADFVSSSNVAASSSLEAATLSRLERYTINSYRFIPTAHENVDANTIRVTTYMYLDYVRKPGAEGSSPRGTVIVNPSPVITWKNYGGTWKIQKGLPYLSSEISF